jgi:transcriptional regulator with XRE-family HTH domain
MVDKRAIGAALKARRLALGLTLRELGARAGLSHSAIDFIERGERNTTIDTLEGLASALGVALDLSTRTGEADPRQGVMDRFRAILPHVPEDDLDVFVHELALWERRYRP